MKSSFDVVWQLFICFSDQNDRRTHVIWSSSWVVLSLYLPSSRPFLLFGLQEEEEEEEETTTRPDNTTHLYNLSKLLSPNATRMLTGPHCRKLHLTSRIMPPCMREGDHVTQAKWLLRNVIFTGDKARRWGYFDQREIALLLKEATEKTFLWMEVVWRQRRRGVSWVKTLNW